MDNTKNITHEDIMFYKRYQEWYYYELYKQRHGIIYKHKYEITDVVKISEYIGHDIGYAGQMGIITNLSISGHVYVLAFDKRAQRYWICGFCEDDLTLINRKYDKMAELTDKYINHLTENNFKMYTSAFKESWEKFKKENSNEGNTVNNVIYVDFKRK